MKATSSLLLSFFFAVGAMADYPEEWEGILQGCAWNWSQAEMGKFSPTIKIYVWYEDIDGDGDTDLWVSNEWGQNGRAGLTWIPYFWTGQEYERRWKAWKDVPLAVAQGTGNVVEIEYERGYPQELLDEAKPQTNFAERVESLWEAKDFNALRSLERNRRRLDPDDLAALLIRTELMAGEDLLWSWDIDKVLKIGAKMGGEHFKAVYPALVERMGTVKSMCRQRKLGQMPPDKSAIPSFPGLAFLRALEEDGYFLRGLPLVESKP